MNANFARRWTAALASVLIAILATGLLPADATAAADSLNRSSFKRPTCLGKPATIVGPGSRRDVRGTPGADVIVTNGAVQVIARGGADLVCITGTQPRNYVTAGPGNDRVVNQTDAEARVSLGTGRDGYRGGPGSDEVSTSGGDDTVHLGGGKDVLRATVTRGPGALYDGGPGEDVVTLRAARELPGPLVVDNVRGRFRTGGTTPVRRLTAFEVFYLGDSRKVTSFLGSGVAEQVLIQGRIGTAEMRGGDDTFTLDRSYPRSFRNRFSVVEGISGGAGLDLFSFNSRGADLSVDLAAGRVVTAYDEFTKGFVVGGFNSLFVNADNVELLGTDGVNSIYAVTCTGTTDTAGGDDTVTIDTPGDPTYGFYCDNETTGVTVRGGDGDDELSGGFFNDVLSGGGGEDSVNGQSGVDQCEAEVVAECESGIGAD